MNKMEKVKIKKGAEFKWYAKLYIVILFISAFLSHDYKFFYYVVQVLGWLWVTSITFVNVILFMYKKKFILKKKIAFNDKYNDHLDAFISCIITMLVLLYNGFTYLGSILLFSFIILKILLFIKEKNEETSD